MNTELEKRIIVITYEDQNYTAANQPMHLPGCHYGPF